ncbi:hypothetical protein Rhow_006128 [Rhodococcus wratislaviensis]|uniref:Uncharacterized protein n=1 Tax=Rhodococcus wratislaviensis TaxID=44752 RepID=A0A402CF70_RHOWR|nr:hypothetical protein Rhow_006128 [Rhodococcus wratislaviensis]
MQSPVDDSEMIADVERGAGDDIDPGRIELHALNPDKLGRRGRVNNCGSMGLRRHCGLL